MVRGYQSLSQVERVFRCLKGVDLKVRPIWLRSEAHVKAHVLSFDLEALDRLCVLAYYVEWHLRAARAELLYADEELEARRGSTEFAEVRTRAPVLPPQTSPAAVAKKAHHVTATGLPVQSFAGLLQDLGTLARNTCLLQDDAAGTSFVRHSLIGWEGDGTSCQGRSATFSRRNRTVDCEPRRIQCFNV